MIKKIPDQFWFPFWVDKWIFGSMRLEFEPDERAVWVDLLALAAKDNGYIRANEQTPYLSQQLAGLLVYDEKFFVKTIDKFLERDKLQRDENGVLYIMNWEKYKFTDAYKRKIKERVKKGIFPPTQKIITESVTPVTRTVTPVTKIVNHNITNHNITNHNKDIKSENSEPLFEDFWKKYPPERRNKKSWCQMKFGALCKKGKYDRFIKVTRGYFDFLKAQRLKIGFNQMPMYSSTWLNNWEGDAEKYENFEYKPRL